MSVSFATVNDALAVHIKPAELRVFIGGTYVNCVEAHTAHGTEQPVGTCDLMLPLPRPSWIDYNVPVRVETGYPGATGVIFDGKIPARKGTFDDNGGWLTVHAAGWASQLQDREVGDLTFIVSNTLEKMFRTLCARRQVPHYLSDATTFPDGVTPITLGGVTEIDDGHILMPRTVSPLAWLTNIGRLFGYRAFDTPSGVFRQMRISGLPQGDALYQFIQGLNAFRFEQDGDTQDMVTYWDVLGARYTAGDGSQVAIRSIADHIPESPLLDPPGYRYRDPLSDQLLVTQALADACRNVQEIDYSAPSETYSWDTEGIPDLQPGDVVEMEAPILGANTRLWVKSVRHDFTDGGVGSSWTGWSGNGQALPAGQDCITQHIGSQHVYHLGDEDIPWYKQPAPDGLSVDIPFMVYDDWSSITVRGYAHGCNSFVAEGGGSTSETISKFEVYQGGSDDSHRVGSGQLPVMAEDYDSQFDYGGSLTHWTALVIPITGSLKPGPAFLRPVAGKGPDDNDDDFEIDGDTLTITVCGIGKPELPASGGGD